jgi:hypothetical protein
VRSFVLNHDCNALLLLDHVLEYENHTGFDRAWKKIPGSEVCVHAYHEAFFSKSFTSLLNFCFSMRKPMTH